VYWVKLRRFPPHSGQSKLQSSSFYPVCFAVDQRPALDRTPIAGLPVGELGFHDEARINDEVERGFVLETDVNRMVLAGGEDLDKIDRLAFDLFKAVERSATVNGGLVLPRLVLADGSKSQTVNWTTERFQSDAFEAGKIPSTLAPFRPMFFAGIFE
jgi:hypothetical protein